MQQSAHEDQPPLVRMETPPPNLDDTTLAAIALGDDAVANACQDEVEARAAAGSIGLRRFLVHVGLRLWAHRRISTERLLEDYEPYARALAATGNDADISLLAGLVAIRADHARELGDEHGAYDAECEALTLVGAIANGSDNPETMRLAAKDFHDLAGSFSEAAREQAAYDLWFVAVLETDQRAEPEVSAIERIKGTKK